MRENIIFVNYTALEIVFKLHRTRYFGDSTIHCTCSFRVHDISIYTYIFSAESVGENIGNLRGTH